jgi:hypothetical protein
MKVLRSGILILVFTLAAGTLGAYQDPIDLGSARTSGMGGRHIALADDFTTYLNNPAGLETIDEEFSFSELTLHLKGPVFTLADVFLSGNLSGLSSVISDGLYAGLNMMGPLSFGYVGDGLGFGIYNHTDVIIKSTSTLTVEAKVRDEVVLTGGYAFPLLPEGGKNRLDMGITLKGGFRGQLNGAMGITELMALNYGVLLDEPFDFTSFIGADVGLMYSHGSSFAAGLVARDAFTPTHTNTYGNINEFIGGNTPISANQFDIVPFALDLGLRYTFDFSGRNIVLTELDTFLDYRDVLDFWLYPSRAVNPILNAQAGVEATLLKILDVRAGFRQGLFSAGLGLDLHFFTLNASMFGTERSSEPGLSPVYNLQIGLEFRN